MKEVWRDFVLSIQIKNSEHDQPQPNTLRFVGLGWNQACSTLLGHVFYGTAFESTRLPFDCHSIHKPLGRDGATHLVDQEVNESPSPTFQAPRCTICPERKLYRVRIETSLAPFVSSLVGLSRNVRVTVLTVLVQPEEPLNVDHQM